jgi:hypothetical protein
MTVRIRTITFDCSDPYLLAGFWSKLTGYGEDPTNTNHPDDPEGLLVAPDGSANLLFIHVPEGKHEVQQPMLTRAYASQQQASALTPQRCAGRSEGHAAGAGHWAAGRVTSPGEAGYSEGKPAAGCGTG